MKVLLIDSLHEVFAGKLIAAGFAITHAEKKNDEDILHLLLSHDGLVLRSRMKISADIINRAPNLKFIARAGAGLENIDTTFAASKNIQCFNSPEGNRDAVGEHATGMLLSLLNNIGPAQQQVRAHIWDRHTNRGEELSAKTLAIIGFGNMGSAFASKLSSFGCKILVYDPYIKMDTRAFPYATQVDMQTVYEQADIISLHVPLTPETTGLVNNDYIRRFTKPIIVINTARGKNVDTLAIAEALKEGKVYGACLDVLEYEPVSFEKMDFDNLPPHVDFLLNHPRVIVTPHIAGWTHESNFKIADILATKIISYFTTKN